MEYGDQPDLWQMRVPYQFVFDALENRAGCMTGDWVIFAKHQGQNFYLGLETHGKARAEDSDSVIYQRLREGSEWEFPFLLQEQLVSNRPRHTPRRSSGRSQDARRFN
jgi:hypothetical protein